MLFGRAWFAPAVVWPSNTVAFQTRLWQSREYRTLDATSPTESYIGCQSSYLPLPAGGWQIAANNQDSQRVIASFRWGTSCVLMATRESIRTASGSACGGSLSTSGDTYKPSGCNRRILLSRPLVVSPGVTSYAHLPNATADGPDWPPRADDWMVVCGSSRAGAPVLVNGVVRSRFSPLPDLLLHCT